ncbi:MAG: NAD-binding protein [Deltaproteobacteria bacterium]|nr:NAD-binding protein [Deltaproteobacteria bacterium]
MPESAAQPRRPAEGHPILVVGLGHVGVAVVHRLHALGVPVRALLTPAEQARQGAELQRLGVETVHASAAWEQDLVRQEFADLGAVVLAADNDSGNVDACLLVRRHSTDVPMLVRVSDPTLVRFLRVSVPHVEPYSMGSVTAPVAAELALQLLSRGGRGTLVKRPTPRSVRVRTALWAMLVIALLTSVVGTVVVASQLKMQGLDALGAAAGWVLTGAAPLGVKMTSGLHWIAVALAIADRTALIAAALLVFDWLLQRRLAGVVQPAPVNLHDHVVVLGAGNVGARVAEILHQRRIAVVVVERDGGLRNVQRLRSAGIAVVVGDTTVDETLDLAGAWQASVVMALTSLDAVNLHVGLLLADRKAAVPTVVRLLSPELSEHATRTADVSPLSPVAETASYVCRAVERLRKERGKRKDPVATSPTPDPARPTGRYAGPEFDAPARNTDQHQKLARAAALAVERAALADDATAGKAESTAGEPGAPRT